MTSAIHSRDFGIRRHYIEKALDLTGIIPGVSFIIGGGEFFASSIFAITRASKKVSKQDLLSTKERTSHINRLQELTSVINESKSDKDRTLKQKREKLDKTYLIGKYIDYCDLGKALIDNLENALYQLFSEYVSDLERKPSFADADYKTKEKSLNWDICLKQLKKSIKRAEKEFSKIQELSETNYFSFLISYMIAKKISFLCKREFLNTKESAKEEIISQLRGKHSLIKDYELLEIERLTEFDKIEKWLSSIKITTIETKKWKKQLLKLAGEKKELVCCLEEKQKAIIESIFSLETFFQEFCGKFSKFKFSESYYQTKEKEITSLDKGSASETSFEKLYFESLADEPKNEIKKILILKHFTNNHRTKDTIEINLSDVNEALNLYIDVKNSLSLIQDQIKAKQGDIENLEKKEFEEIQKVRSAIEEKNQIQKRLFSNSEAQKVICAREICFHHMKCGIGRMLWPGGIAIAVYHGYGKKQLAVEYPTIELV